MRLVEKKEEVLSALRGVRSEAKSSFGDDRMYMEKFVEKPRHVEVQVLGDTHEQYHSLIRTRMLLATSAPKGH